MSNTPMTDDRVVYKSDVANSNDWTQWVNAPLARQLERELSAANERIKRLEEAGDAVVSEPCEYTFEQWIQAKEAKP